ncbi:MAG: leucyl/phenylalanyl-tRNA--protein transferase [Chthonomonas sp.]|nr:leucyl/phenylalanyl-tRNA--protein transferase [Chthonomonas sp.]
MSPAELLNVYRAGYFPMGEEGSDEVGLYGTRTRALMPIEGLRVSRSFAKFLRSHPYRVSFDENFAGVIRGCRRPEDNWITPPIIEMFTEAHRAGIAHSCEVWDGNELVGGTYGLAVGGIFSAESMFHRRTNCSKLALHSLIEHCRCLGFAVMDAQIMNPHLASLGAIEVSHVTFRRLLDQHRADVIWRNFC